MSNSLHLTESLAHDRHAERYRHSRHTPLDSAAALTSESRATETTRHRAGWLLVGVGLRLVTGRRDAPARRARLIGQ